MKSMFWGVLIVVVGLLVIVNAVFGINLPVFKILLGLALIYWGLKVLFGGFNLNFSFSSEKRTTEREAIFSTSTFKFPLIAVSDDKEYVTVFGASTLDLSDLAEIPGEPIEIVSVFGESKLFVKKGTPLVVESQTVFGSTKLPENNKNAFGQFVYKSPEVKEGVKALKIKASIVFGSLEVIEK